MSHAEQNLAKFRSYQMRARVMHRLLYKSADKRDAERKDSLSVVASVCRIYNPHEFRKPKPSLLRLERAGPQRDTDKIISSPFVLSFREKKENKYKFTDRILVFASLAIVFRFNFIVTFDDRRSTMTRGNRS